MKLLKKKKSTASLFQQEMYLPKKSLKKTKRAQGGESRGRIYRGTLLSILWLFFLGVFGYMLFFSDLFRITQQNIDGGSVITSPILQGVLDEERAGAWFSIIRKDNLLFFPPSRVAKIFKREFPLIDTVRVERHFPNTLSIHIQEKPYQLLGCSGDTCFLIDVDGQTSPLEAFSKRPSQQGTVYTIRDLSGHAVGFDEQFLPPQTVAFIREVINTFEPATGLALDPAFEMSSRFANELRIKTRDGFMVYLNTQIPLEESYAVLKVFLGAETYGSVKDKLRYIDVRVADRVYYTRTDEAPADPVQETKDEPGSSTGADSGTPSDQDAGTSGM